MNEHLPTDIYGFLTYILTLMGVILLGVKGIQEYYKNEAAERLAKAEERKAAIEQVASKAAEEAGTSAAKEVLKDFTLGWAKPMEARLGNIESDLADIKKEMARTNERFTNYFAKK